MMLMLRLPLRLTRQCVRYKKTKSARAEVPGQALQMAIRQIESNFGKGALMQLGASGVAQDIEVISTGSLSLDIALGIGGLPKGYGGTCAFVDAEHAIDGHYAKALGSSLNERCYPCWSDICHCLGVNIDELYVSQPDSGEQALEIADTLIRSGAVDVVVVDSVAALVPRAELEGEMGDQQIALQARLMSQALRKLTGSLSKSNCMLIFLNQIRQKVGVLFGSPEVTSGGTALRYYASVRLDIRRKTQIKDGDNVIGNETVVKVAKNKLAPPFKVATFDMLYGKGVDRVSEVVIVGIEADIRQTLLARSTTNIDDEVPSEASEEVDTPPDAASLVEGPPLVEDAEPRVDDAPATVSPHS
ncbi:hypothetical protein DYB38_012419 [Aphanomyces astaci]|uniref:Uncharacterized protein n=1 Tax=Aphanomyces astaci TaxID=112090 RepID=A0A397DCB2_APHAT|nr:hypothetical protein DYB38_012419 [Aphanomyces astaci]